MAEKVYKNITAVVRTIHPETEVVESTQVKNIDSKERREWLLSVVMYGLFNNKVVEIVNKDDDKDGVAYDGK